MFKCFCDRHGDNDTFLKCDARNGRVAASLVIPGRIKDSRGG